VEQISADNNVRAMMLRDQGKVDEARKVLQHNTQYLYDNAARYNSKRLQDYGVSNEGDAKNLSPGKWKKRRKEMREMQFEFMH
jgi:Ca-activated chloride channel family protein